MAPGIPLIKNLGVKPGQKLLIMNAPEEYLQRLAPLPEGSVLETSGQQPFDYVQFFMGNKEDVDTNASKAIQVLKPGGIRPGTVLEVGDVFSFSGNIAPTLPVHVEAEVTTSSGQVMRISGEANKIGYFYDPGGDFVVTEPGLYVVQFFPAGILQFGADSNTDPGTIIGCRSDFKESNGKF